MAKAKRNSRIGKNLAFITWCFTGETVYPKHPEKKDKRINYESEGVSETMKKEAELHAEEDKKKKELVEKKNEADSLIFQTEKTLKDAGDKITEDEKKEIESAVKELKEAKDKEDATVESIDEAFKKASESLSKYGERLYKVASEAQPGSANDSSSGPAPEPKSGDKPEEGEVVDEGGDKK